MKKSDIIRAWRDPEYRASLSEAERASLPNHPAGLLELDAESLASALGGADDEPIGVVKEPAPYTINTAYASAYNCKECCV